MLDRKSQTTKFRGLVFPTPHINGDAVVKDLSIAESVAGSLTPVAAIWFFEKGQSPDALDTFNLIKSLRQTLEVYPFLAGKLERVPFRRHSRQQHMQRQGRLRIIYSSSEDIGVNVTVNSSQESMTSVMANGGLSNGKLDKTRYTDLIGEEVMLAMHDNVLQEGCPIMSIKLTYFSDGGLALAVRQVHCVGDVQSTIRFLKDWARLYTAAQQNDSQPEIQSLFDPDLLTSKAAGDINAPVADAKIVEFSRQLPVHRFDWFVLVENLPEGLEERALTPQGLTKEDLDRHGTGVAMPWHDWDATAPTMQQMFHFTPQEINSIHAATRLDSPASKTSHLDTLLAHMWILTLRARGKLSATKSATDQPVLTENDPVYLNFVMDWRPRLQLPTNLFGSPSAMVHATINPGTTSNLGNHAEAIRSAVNKMDGTAIAALLHDQAHTVAAQRHWQYFPGRRHVNVTSWARSGTWDIQFGTASAVSVLPWLPDYLLVILDGKPAGQDQPVSTAQTNPAVKQRWFDNGGIDVLIQLEESVVQAVLKDPYLHAFRDTLDEAKVLPEIAVPTLSQQQQQQPRHILTSRPKILPRMSSSGLETPVGA